MLEYDDAVVSELEHILSEIESYEKIDYEYVHKGLDAAEKARNRIDARIDKIRGRR
jgi:hypothetical protein